MSLQKSVWENSESSFCLFFVLCSQEYHIKLVVKIKRKWAISPGFVNERSLYSSVPQDLQRQISLG